jgi:hypothetical protein
MSVTTIQIKNPLGKILFEHTAENNSLAKTIGAAKAAEAA